MTDRERWERWHKGIPNAPPFPTLEQLWRQERQAIAAGVECGATRVGFDAARGRRVLA